MKELTIEQKAKAYDKAIERAKSMIDDLRKGEDILAVSDLEEMFPELKESGDEKIRTFLHHTFTAQYLCKDKLGKWHGEPVANILAWLEKQGKIDKVSYEIAEKEKNDFVSGQFIECRKSFNEFKEGNSYWLEYAGNDNYIGRSDNILNQKFHITPRQLYRLFTQQHFSKENNTNEETNAPTEYDKYVDECLNEASKHFFSEGEDKYSVADLFYAGVRCGKSWLEKQGKETSWKPSKEEMDVLYGLAYITNQYDEHKEEVITRLYQDLKREFFNGSSYENMFPTNTSTEDDVRRRSTIQVLEYARSLDTYNQYGKADIDKNIAWLERQDEKDKFIKKELGCIKVYRENAIKRLEELEKQGEQKPAKVEPKFKVGDIMRTLEEAADGFTDGMPVVVSIDDEDYHCTNERIAIKDQDEYEYPPMNRKHDICDSCDEQKPAWSKEDEYCINQLIIFCENCMVQDTNARRCADWLKSLKERYTWKPSDEQIHWLKWAINIMPDTEIANEAEAVLEDLLEQLKKL